MRQAFLSVHSVPTHICADLRSRSQLIPPRLWVTLSLIRGLHIDLQQRIELFNEQIRNPHSSHLLVKPCTTPPCWRRLYPSHLLITIKVSATFFPPHVHTDRWRIKGKTNTYWSAIVRSWTAMSCPEQFQCVLAQTRSLELYWRGINTVLPKEIPSIGVLIMMVMEKLSDTSICNLS